MLNNVNPNDYNQKLNNTLVRYNNFPVQLTYEGGSSFIIYGIHGGSSFKKSIINVKDPLLDISTPILGWFKLEHDGIKYAAYLERLPVRRWRQGLCSSNTKISYLSRGRLSQASSTKEYIYSKGVEDMILDKYEPLDELLKSLNNADVHSVAASHNIAIAKKDDIYTVWFKKDEVGWMKPGTKVVKIPKEENIFIISRFLRELKWEIE